MSVAGCAPAALSGVACRLLLARAVIAFAALPVGVSAEVSCALALATDGGIADQILQNAPAREDHFFLVPKVIE